MEVSQCHPGSEQVGHLLQGLIRVNYLCEDVVGPGLSLTLDLHGIGQNSGFKNLYLNGYLGPRSARQALHIPKIDSGRGSLFNKRSHFVPWKEKGTGLILSGALTSTWPVSFALDFFCCEVPAAC